MSLIIGTDSYVTVEEADKYHAAMGNSAWTQDDENNITQKEAALRKAASFLDIAASGKWKGIRAMPQQALAWPRKNVVDNDGYPIPADVIPSEVKRAACEAALRIYGGDDLLPDETYNVASESVAGAVSVSYFEGKSSTPTYSAIYGLLNGLVISPLGGSGTNLSFSTKGYEYW